MISIPPVPRWLIAPVFSGERLMYVDMQDWFTSRFCMNDRFELPETAIIQQLLRPGDTFLDIGANLGWYSLAASLALQGLGHIHAFEPREDTGNRLEMTLELNGLTELVTVHHKGVWHEATELRLFVGDQTAPGSSHTTNDALSEDVIAMPVLAIDSLELPACNVIKIDIEGAEPHAIRGAERTLARHRPFILSELNGKQLRAVSEVGMDEYLSQLAGFGYGAFYTSGRERGCPVSVADERLQTLPFASVLFVPREKPMVW